LGARDQAANGNLSFGLDPALKARLFRVWRQWDAYRGADLTTGERLRAILHDAGFENIQMTATYTVAKAGEGIARIFGDPQMREATLEQGWADQTFFDELMPALATWGNSPDSLWAVARGEAIGWKPAQA
jgi:hypothetical protein